MTAPNIDQVRSFLAALTPGQLPKEIFDEAARLTVTPVLEIVLLHRDTSGSIRVLLARKADDDALWPGKFHVPGAVILATDRKDDFEDAAQRALKKVAGVTVGQLRIVKSTLCDSVRGTELAVLSYAEILDISPGTNLYELDALPKDLIEGHKDFITAAAEARAALRD